MTSKDDEHEGSFAEGQAEDDPDDDTHGDFAEGQERSTASPTEVEKGTFAEGQADEDEDPVTPERGRLRARTGRGRRLSPSPRRAWHDSPMSGGAGTAPHVLIVGGGGTGGALAHDLALRGVQVTLVERGEFTSGTTGRHHGLLHSGARYAVNDEESAIECIEENMLLRRIAPGSFEENDGLFVGITDEDMAYLPSFLEGCERDGHPDAGAASPTRHCGWSRT